MEATGWVFSFYFFYFLFEHPFSPIMKIWCVVRAYHTLSVLGDLHIICATRLIAHTPLHPSPSLGT